MNYKSVLVFHSELSRFTHIISEVDETMYASAEPLPVGYSNVPNGHIATVVTGLEMLEQPSRGVRRTLSPDLNLERLVHPSLEIYRKLYFDIGSKWLWGDRLVMTDSDLASIVLNNLVEIYAVTKNGTNLGFFELDFRETLQCELTYFGLTSSIIGMGNGRALMDEAVARVWSKNVKRFWVHTCTLDHPAALSFYIRSGFQPFAVGVQVLPDPRAHGLIPDTVAPHIPIST